MLLTVLIIILVMVVIFYFGLKMYYNYGADSGRLQLATTSILGICPAGWSKQMLTDGTYCIQPDSYITVGQDGTYNGAGRGTCVEGDIMSWLGSGETISNVGYCGKYIPGISDAKLEELKKR